MCLGDNCGRENYPLLYFFLCLLNLYHVYDLLIMKYSNDKKEKLSLALHLYLSQWYIYFSILCHHYLYTSFANLPYFSLRGYNSCQIITNIFEHLLSAKPDSP